VAPAGISSKPRASRNRKCAHPGAARNVNITAARPVHPRLRVGKIPLSAKNSPARASRQYTERND